MTSSASHEIARTFAGGKYLPETRVLLVRKSCSYNTDLDTSLKVNLWKGLRLSNKVFLTSKLRTCCISQKLSVSETLSNLCRKLSQNQLVFWNAPVSAASINRLHHQTVPGAYESMKVRSCSSLYRMT